MIPLQHGVLIAVIIFILGLTGIVIRRNILFILLGLEIMLNSSALLFVIAGNYWGQEDGQIMCIIVITISAIEAGVGLALMIRLHLDHHISNIDLIGEIQK